MPDTDQMKAAVAVLQRTTKRIEDLADDDEVGLERQRGAAGDAITAYVAALGGFVWISTDETPLEAEQRGRITELEALLETMTAPDDDDDESGDQD